VAPQRQTAAFVKSNGIELCYDTFGDPRASPIVLIMGLAAQMIAWDEEFCAELAARGHYVVRFDNRDAGLSTRLESAGVPNVTSVLIAAAAGRPIQAPYLLQDMAQDVVGLLDALRIPTAHIVGASMGGAVGQTLALRHPARLRSLTSIMSTTGARDLPPPTPEALRALLSDAPSDLVAYLEYHARVWRVLRAGRFPLDEARDPARARQIFERGLNPAGVARQMTAMLGSGSRREALASLQVPTLVIHGEADPLLPLACGIDTAKSVPGSTLVIVKGMGHALSMPFWPQIIEAIAVHAQSNPHGRVALAGESAPEDEDFNTQA
jgi:pimeloyl-ACP methyl ester carboxylesterase